jgi:hypothetical protein
MFIKEFIQSYLTVHFHYSTKEMRQVVELKMLKLFLEMKIKFVGEVDIERKVKIMSILGQQRSPQKNRRK